MKEAPMKKTLYIMICITSSVCSTPREAKLQQQYKLRKEKKEKRTNLYIQLSELEQKSKKISQEIGQTNNIKPLKDELSSLLEKKEVILYECRPKKGICLVHRYDLEITEIESKITHKRQQIEYKRNQKREIKAQLGVEIKQLKKSIKRL